MDPNHHGQTVMLVLVLSCARRVDIQGQAIFAAQGSPETVWLGAEIAELIRL
jgi:hypothetical protein